MVLGVYYLLTDQRFQFDLTFQKRNNHQQPSVCKLVPLKLMLFFFLGAWDRSLLVMKNQLFTPKQPISLIVEFKINVIFSQSVFAYFRIRKGVIWHLCGSLLEHQYLSNFQLTNSQWLVAFEESKQHLTHNQMVPSYIDYSQNNNLLLTNFIGGIFVYK